VSGSHDGGDVTARRKMIFIDINIKKNLEEIMKIVMRFKVDFLSAAGDNGIHT
jgi:hypothetical protein